MAIASTTFLAAVACNPGSADARGPGCGLAGIGQSPGMGYGLGGCGDDSGASGYGACDPIYRNAYGCGH